MRFKSLAAWIAAAFCAVAPAGETASAATYRLFLQDSSAPFGGASGKIGYSLDGKAKSAWAGPIAVTDETFGDFVAWCLQIDVAFREGKTYHDGATLSAGTVAALDLLFDNAYSLLDFSSQADMVGFQTAVWETVYDAGNIGLGTGRFRLATGGDVRARAEDFLTGRVTGGADQNLSFLKSGASQNFARASAAQTPAIPLPATIWLMLAAVGGLAALRRLA